MIITNNVMCLSRFYVIDSYVIFKSTQHSLVVVHDEVALAANSLMPDLADDDRGKQTHQSQMPLYSQLEGTGSSVGWSAGSSSGSSSSSSGLKLAMLLGDRAVGEASADRG
ncbi:hypothetical protein Tco_1326917 [Tanacetum coccineum]